MKRTPAKPRTVSICLEADRPLELGPVVMPDGTVRFVREDVVKISTAIVETTYGRPKGPKVLSRLRARLADGKPTIASALVQFDTLFAIDTNTRSIKSIRVSVAAIVRGKWRDRATACPSLMAWPVVAIELRSVDCSAEKLAWKIFIADLEANPNRSTMGRVGIIVDAHLAELDEINARRSPVLDDYFLPSDVQFLYATADSGAENPANGMLRLADRSAREVLNGIEGMPRLDVESVRVDVPHTTYFRLWTRRNAKIKARGASNPTPRP